MSEPESLEEQAAQEGYVPEYQPDEDQEEWEHMEHITNEQSAMDEVMDMSDPYDIEYDVP